jgi:hypothetical protein
MGIALRATRTWRNGRRKGLKIPREDQSRVGSTPTVRTILGGESRSWYENPLGVTPWGFESPARTSPPPGGKEFTLNVLAMASPHPTDELFQVADAAVEARNRLRDRSLQEPLSAIRDTCESIARAWSGSNLGYHAAVYYNGLEPKPAGVEFSPEWGLMDRWPTHQPHPGWHNLDPEWVISEIRRRAGDPDLQVLSRSLAAVRATFLDLKETAVSVLSAILGIAEDSFMRRKLSEIEGLNAPETNAIAWELVAGQVFSRDQLAISQGLRVAPHQNEMALPMSAAVLENSIDALERATRAAGSHLRRVEGGGGRVGMVGTNIFIGHGRSPVWRELRDFIRDRLNLPVDEFNSVPVAGVTTAARLTEMLAAAAFAFLVLTAEDEQADGQMRARENVVHEVGLFQGRLGFTKAIVLLEEGCQEFSNIHGLGQIRFPKGNISAKFEEIRAVLEREGII